jgi:hypothetical protein
MDIKDVFKNIENKIDTFSVRQKSKSGEPVYEEGVLIICSGMEFDVSDYLKKENKTGVKVEIRDILTDKKNLIFKKKPEAKIEVKVKDKKLSVEIKEFYSPILMRKLEIENAKILQKEYQAEDLLNKAGVIYKFEITGIPKEKKQQEAGKQKSGGFGSLGK